VQYANYRRQTIFSRRGRKQVPPTDQYMYVICILTLLLDPLMQ